MTRLIADPRSQYAVIWKWKTETGKRKGKIQFFKWSFRYELDGYKFTSKHILLDIEQQRICLRIHLSRIPDHFSVVMNVPLRCLGGFHVLNSFPGLSSKLFSFIQHCVANRAINLIDINNLNKLWTIDDTPVNYMYRGRYHKMNTKWSFMACSLSFHSQSICIGTIIPHSM